jgi:predicted amino acid-binding ACT domain protein
MRAALGWHAGLRLFVWTHTGKKSVDALRNQLSVSAYLPRVKELWHLSGRFRDRPGMMTELSGLLAELQVDVITCRASTQAENSEFMVDMELETSAYNSDYDLSSDERRKLPNRQLRELYARIVSKFIKEIVFGGDGQPQLTITRNPVLSGAIRADQHHEVTLRQHGWIILPSDLMSDVRTSFEHQFPRLSQASATAATPIALIAADTRWGVCDLTFYYRDTGHKHIRVRARDQVGTLQAITSALRDRSFNMLQLYSRTLPNEGFGYIDLLVQSLANQVGDDRSLARSIRAAVTGVTLSELDITLTFPRAQKPGQPRRK